jgi:hypothetical protein
MENYSKETHIQATETFWHHMKWTFLLFALVVGIHFAKNFYTGTYGESGFAENLGAGFIVLFGLPMIVSFYRAQSFLCIVEQQHSLKSQRR